MCPSPPPQSHHSSLLPNHIRIYPIPCETKNSRTKHLQMKPRNLNRYRQWVVIKEHVASSSYPIEVPRIVGVAEDEIQSVNKTLNLNPDIRGWGLPSSAQVCAHTHTHTHTHTYTHTHSLPRPLTPSLTLNQYADICGSGLPSSAPVPTLLKTKPPHLPTPLKTKPPHVPTPLRTKPPNSESKSRCSWVV